MSEVSLAVLLAIDDHMFYVYDQKILDYPFFFNLFHIFHPISIIYTIMHATNVMEFSYYYKKKKGIHAPTYDFEGLQDMRLWFLYFFLIGLASYFNGKFLITNDGAKLGILS